MGATPRSPVSALHRRSPWPLSAPIEKPAPVSDPTREGRRPTFAHAIIPVVVLVVLLVLNLRFDPEALPHIPLVLGAAAAAVTGLGLGKSWRSIESGMVQGIVISLRAVLILMTIGMLIGTWISGGIVPLLIVYGLDLLSPDWFLPAACLICAVVSLSTGSSWTTAATVGVALIGVGPTLGIPLPMVAGAIISGAYFGDKMSPLSDTTNLAPAVAGSELFEHVRHMFATTFPALVISLVLYAILGRTVAESGKAVAAGFGDLRATLESSFHLTPWLLSVPLLVVGLILRRVPALPALLIGSLGGHLLAVLFQDAPAGSFFLTALDGYLSDTGNEAVDQLLGRGGLLSMMATVALILCAMAFGGIMERCGFLEALASGVLRIARGTGSLISATVATCVGMNAVAPDQYLSIVVPGRMYRSAFERMGLQAKALSRTLEDAGTLTSPLIAYNTCGAYMATALGVAAGDYWIYCFLNLITPVVAITYGFTGWFIAKLPETDSRENDLDGGNGSTHRTAPEAAKAEE